MATLRSSSKNDGATGTAISVDVPAGAASGDFVVCIVQANSQTTIADNNGSAAFTEAPNFSDYKPNTSNGHTVSVFSRTLNGTEGASFAFTSGASGRWSVIAICYNGAHEFDVAPNTANAANNDSASTGNITCPAITTGVANAHHVTFCAWDTSAYGTITTPTGYTLLQNANTDGEPMHVSYKNIASAGSTGTVNHSNTEYAAMITSSFSIKVSGGVTYTLTASVGSITLTGIAALALYNKYLSSVKGTFTLTGISSGLLATRKLTASLGTFICTGFASGISTGRHVLASLGTFTITGIANALTVSRTISIQLGTFTITGIAVAINKIYHLVADLGTFVFSGIDTTLRVARKLTVSVGTFMFIGIDVAITTVWNYILTAATATYTLTGIQAGLITLRKLTADLESYVLTGISTGILYARKFTIALGTFTLTGIATGLIVLRKLTATVVTFVFTGRDATLRKIIHMTASAGSFILTGISPLLNFNLAGVIKNAIGIIKEFTRIGHQRESVSIWNISTGVRDQLNDPELQYDQSTILYDDPTVCYNNYISSEKPAFILGKKYDQVSISEQEDKPRISKK